jgi:predicted aconitase with swiveling domain
MTIARILHKGVAQGPVLALDAPLSFWGAFDPRSGEIIDIHHPQKGMRVSGMILMMRETQGSGTAPGGMAEAIRLGTAPAGIILVKPDINLAIGALVAEVLYGRSCPIMSVDDRDYASLARSGALAIGADGRITQLPPAGPRA